MVGYIFLSNRARWWEKKLNIIITTKFKEYYIYEISNLNRRCVEKLRKLIKKDNIKQVACEEEIQTSYGRVPDYERKRGLQVEDQFLY